MTQPKDNYQLLIDKLDRFIRKFYVNQLIRGSLYSIALILFLFIVINVLEYYFFFGIGMRKAMFYSFIGISGFALIYWVIMPLMHYFRLGKLISHERAAGIIGNHFLDVKDKLLNILQLKKQSDSAAHADLSRASINQKTDSIKLVPFKSAINLGQNKKYLRYALPPLLLLLVLLFAAPSLIKDSTTRLINNNKIYEREAPFHFIVDEEDLTIVQFSDYLLKVKIEGDLLPNEVFIDIDNYKYRLNKDSNNLFSYQFSNVQKEMDFKLFSNNVTSADFTLNVLKKPNITGFEVKLDYPAYTKRKDENLANIGDLVVPLGTNIDWILTSQNTDDIAIRFSNESDNIKTNRFSEELFTYKKRVLRDERYKFFISNNDLPNADSIAYSITVIPDLHPTISVEQFADSTDSKLLFFVGDAGDDYGLLNITFNYRINKNKGPQGVLNTSKVLQPTERQVQYDYTWDIAKLKLEPGDEVSYFFEVFDNDGINGSKSARTNVMNYKKPTVEQFEEIASKNNDEIKKNLEESLKESKKIQEDMKKLREKLLQEKEMDWQTRKELEKLMDRKNELEQKIQDAKKDFEENQKNQEEFEKPNEELLEKQEKIQQMFEELMSDEMKELMQRIEELMQELEKENALEMMEDMEMNDEQLEMELDRMLEMFKQLEMEMEMEKMVNDLEELAKEQEELSEETEKTEETEPAQEELEEKQEDINEKFDDLKEKMEELEEKNKDLENPKNLGEDNDEQMEDIKQDMNESKEQIQKSQNKNASKSQKKAAQKMKQMAEQMAANMKSGEMEQLQEDMEALRQLLENLVNLSFDQEDLIEMFSITNINTPRYVEKVQDQNKLKDDFQLIQDSLQELSKRVIQIETFVTEKVTEIKTNLKESINELEERRKNEAANHQQRTMKNVNDLALMLSEVMDQMQQQMSSMMQGNQMCNKPGNSSGKQGNVPMDKITNSQKELGEQLKKMKEGLEKGKGKGSSKEFAQMAAKQAALRKALKEKQKALQERGKGSKEMQDIIDQMDKIETDLVNKQLSNELMKRQQEIITRLLEAERAEREKEYDQKRKAEAGTAKERKMPPSLEEYIKKREAEIDMYKAVSPALKPYYKFLVEEYFKSLKKQ